MMMMERIELQSWLTPWGMTLPRGGHSWVIQEGGSDRQGSLASNRVIEKPLETLAPRSIRYYINYVAFSVM